MSAFGVPAHSVHSNCWSDLLIIISETVWVWSKEKDSSCSMGKLVVSPSFIWCVPTVLVLARAKTITWRCIRVSKEKLCQKEKALYREFDATRLVRCEIEDCQCLNAGRMRYSSRSAESVSDNSVWPTSAQRTIGRSLKKAEYKLVTIRHPELARYHKRVVRMYSCYFLSIGFRPDARDRTHYDRSNKSGRNTVRTGNRNQCS